MPVYEYTALDAKGKNVSGIIDIESVILARQKLRSTKIYPISIKEVYDKPSEKKEQKSLSFQMPFSRVKPPEIAMMTRQLSSLVGAGFPLVSAIYTMVPQAKSQALKRILSQIKDSIEEGSSFAKALSSYPEVFPEIYINMVHAAETSGTLEIVLERLADITEKQLELSNKIRSALTYPIIMAIMGMLVTVFMLAFIVPNITTIFNEMDQALPASTRFLIVSGDILKSYWYLIIISFAIAVAAFQYIKKTDKGRYFLDKLILSMPVTGALSEKIAVARFARTLGSLLENGVSMIAALEIVKNVVGNVLVSNTIESAGKEVEKGNPLNRALAASNVFPHLSIQMIQVGEQSGELESMLTKIADIYESEVEYNLIRMTSLLEPAIMVIMAVVIGFIIYSIAIPIMEMNQLVK